MWNLFTQNETEKVSQLSFEKVNETRYENLSLLGFVLRYGVTLTVRTVRRRERGLDTDPTYGKLWVVHVKNFRRWVSSSLNLKFLVGLRRRKLGGKVSSKVFSNRSLDFHHLQVFQRFVVVVI